MQKWVGFVIFRGVPCKSQGIQYYDLIFCWGQYLTTPINCAKFERNLWFEHYHPLPGSLMDTLLNFVVKTTLIWLVLGGFFCVFSQSETICNLQFLNSCQICCDYVSIAPHYYDFDFKIRPVFFKIQAGKTFSYHGHVLVTLHVQFLCSDWLKFDGWVHA